MNFLQNLWEMILDIVPPVHKDGKQIILVVAVIAIIIGYIDESDSLDFWLFLATLYTIYFFRDPNRVVPQKEGLVVSPADGVVSAIEEEASPPPELGSDDRKFTKISIFLNIFNVHVNRIPISGKIEDINYRPGKFVSANLDKASEENERQLCLVRTEDGHDIIFVQIAGLVARRIICDLEENQSVTTGERYGLIRFGSRVDVYLPQGINPQVAVGQIAVGGETILADTKSGDESLEGEII